MNIQNQIKKQLLNDDIIFIARMDNEGKLTVIVDLLKKNIFFLLWHKYVNPLYTYGMSSESINTKDVKYYFMQYLDKNEIHSMIFNQNHHSLIHALEKQYEVKLLYAFLHVRDRTLDIMNVLHDIYKECVFYSITARELAECILGLNGIEEDLTTETDIKIHLCNMNTLTEQIFKANDCIILKNV